MCICGCTRLPKRLLLRLLLILYVSLKVTSIHFLIFVCSYSGYGFDEIVVLLHDGTVFLVIAVAELSYACAIGIRHDGDNGRLLFDVERL